MKRFLGVIFIHLCFINIIYGQSFTVEGTVNDASGQPLPGVNILIEGTSNGTVTNMDGYYSLQLPSGEVTLLYSFIGMNTVKEKVAGRNQINVVLTDDSQQLEDVMVVAYGTTTKEAYTGSAQVVEAEVIENRPVTSFEKALQGTTAGLQVTSSSGQPGATAQVRIRGIGSLSAGSSPLYVVDGVPIAGGLNSINPNDIESTTVLKDAVSASLYGSRAANGVIVITTKKGKTGKTRISFSALTGIANRISDGYPLMNSTQFYEHSWMGAYNRGLMYGEHTNGTPYTSADAIAYAHGSVKDIVGYNPFGIEKPLDDNGRLIPGTQVLTNTDWRNEVYKTGVIQNYNLNISGGTEATKVYFSLGYYDDNGTVLSSNYKRYSSKINVEHKVNSFITAGVNSLMSYSIVNGPPSGSGGANPTRSADIINAASPVKMADGSWAWGNKAAFDFNPVALAQMDVYRSKGMRSMLSSYINVDILKSLSFRTTGSIDYSHTKGLTYYNPEHGNGAAVNGRSTMSSAEGYVWNISNIISWNRYTDLSSFEIIAGQEASGTYSESLGAGVTDFAIPGKYDLVWGSQPSEPGSGSSESNLISYLGQAKYNYDSRYYLDASIRTDGSSRFGSEYKYGLFYSAGASWRIKQENWMQDILWLNDLKLRASYGVTGNNNIGNYASLGLYSGGANYGGYPGLGASQPPNPNIHWESMTSINFGIDATLFKNLSASIDLYEKKSDGLLYSLPLSSDKGFTSITTNLGAMKNYGIEAMLTYRKQFGNIDNETSFNITANRNEILNLDVERLTGATQMREVGGDMHQFFMKEWAGVNPDNGDPMWFTNAQSDDRDNNEEPESAFTDPNGSGRMVTSSYEDAERTRQGSALPDFYGGLANSLSYKNIDFAFNWYFSIGGQIYNYDYAANMHDGTNTGYNLSNDALAAWTPNNRYTNVPKYVENNNSGSNQISTRFLEDASYLRLKTISLSYNLPQSICSKLKMQGLKVFVSAENLLTFTSFKGFDPEGALSGTTNNNIPGVKTYTFGIKMDM
jgi:TonB-linked SusC/RagA family outer membrane protein